MPRILPLALISCAGLCSLLLSACAGLNQRELGAGEAPVYFAGGKATNPKEPAAPIYDSSADTAQDRPILVRTLALFNLHIPSATKAQTTPADQADIRAQLQALAGSAEPYRIGAGDVLQLRIAGLAEGSNSERELSVDAQGTLDLGDLGAYRALGLTPDQLQRVLQAELSGPIYHASVGVRVAQYRSQFVRLQGQVYAPGLYPIDAAPMSLAEAITRAGSLLADADLSRVSLTRNGQRIPLNVRQLYAYGLAPENIMLRNGDVLDFPARP